MPAVVLVAIAHGMARVLPNESRGLARTLRNEHSLGGHSAVGSVHEIDGVEGIQLTVTLNTYKPNARSFSIWIDPADVATGFADVREIPGVLL